MHDDDNRFQRLVPLLRRVIILLAVLAATPVVLWMITAFVRAYVGPPKVPTFRQLASTAAPMAAPATAATNASNSDQTPAAPMQAKLADIANPTTEAPTTTSDARDVPLPKGSLLGDRPADGAASAPANLPTVASAPSALPPQAPSAGATPMNVTTGATPSSGPAPVLQQPTANAATAEASQPAAVAEQPADTMPPAPPLTGKIPLPRHRPRGLGEATMTQMAQSAIPMPRPRPDSAGPAPPPETTSPSPLEFLQTIFH